jgi:hypothetical protein
LPKVLEEDTVKAYCEAIDPEGDILEDVLNFRAGWERTTKAFELGTPKCSWRHAFVEVLKVHLKC